MFVRHSREFILDEKDVKFIEMGMGAAHLDKFSDEEREQIRWRWNWLKAQLETIDNEIEIGYRKEDQR